MELAARRLAPRTALAPQPAPLAASVPFSRRVDPAAGLLHDQEHVAARAQVEVGARARSHLGHQLWPAGGELARDQPQRAGRPHVADHPAQHVLSGEPARRLLVVPQRRAALEKIVLHATSLRIPIVEVEGGSLTALSGFDGHQGVALVVEARQFAGVDDILARAAERSEPPFVLVLDSLEDPHNVGSLLRSAEGAGVHGVVFPRHRQAPLSPSAVKASAGAVEHQQRLALTADPRVHVDAAHRDRLLVRFHGRYYASTVHRQRAYPVVVVHRPRVAACRDCSVRVLGFEIVVEAPGAAHP